MISRHELSYLLVGLKKKPRLKMDLSVWRTQTIQIQYTSSSLSPVQNENIKPLPKTKLNAQASFFRIFRLPVLYHP